MQSEKMAGIRKDDEENNRKIRVLIADDHALIRETLHNILEQEEDFIVAGEAKDGEQAVSLATELSVDVVIMDIGMPKLSGIEATRRIKNIAPETIVLVLTVFDDSEHVLSILEAGASAYLTKNVISEDIPRAIRAVLNGESVLSEEIMQQLLKYALRYPLKPISLEYNEKLTSREMEILQFVAQGYSNKIIADKLDLSLHTIKKYMMNIFDKLKANSRTEAVINGQRAGLLSVDDINCKTEETL